MEEKQAGTWNPAAILRTLSQVQWPSFGELIKASGMVILFTVLFGLYFFVCELAASSLVSWIVSL